MGFDKLTALLRSRYSGSRQADKYRSELRLRRRQPVETLSALYQDVRRLIALLHPSLPQDARDKVAVDYFVDVLGDPNLALKVRERYPGLLDDALHAALKLEAWTKDANERRVVETPSVSG